jgi:hypothetical protein
MTVPSTKNSTRFMPAPAVAFAVNCTVLLSDVALGAVSVAVGAAWVAD